MPLKKPSSLRLVPPPAKPRKTVRNQLNSIGWWFSNKVDDADLFEVLQACRDPKLTAELAGLARKRRKERNTRSATLEGLIAWLDGWDGTQETAWKMASDLIDAIDIQVDEETGAAWAPPRTKEECEEVFWAVFREVDGKGNPRSGKDRLRGALGVLWGDAKKADRALKFLDMRASRAGRQRKRVRAAKPKS